MCVCVRAGERKRVIVCVLEEREIQRYKNRESLCVKERERERERERENG